jgi:hypothetical protein
MQSPHEITIDGVYPASFTQVVYDDSENEFVGQLTPGYHSLKITATGYNEISGTVKVCSWLETRIDVSPTKSVSLGKTGINSAAIKIPTTTTTAASGGISKSGGAFSNVPLSTTTVPAAGSTVSVVAAAPSGSSGAQASATA